MNIYFLFLFLIPQHPYIFPTAFATANENGCIVIRDFVERGSLRDMICKCKPKGTYLHKYSNPKAVMQLDFDTIKTFGRQILEALKFLQEKGFPYGELYGNVCSVNQDAKVIPQGLINPLLIGLVCLSMWGLDLADCEKNHWLINGQKSNN